MNQKLGSRGAVSVTATVRGGAAGQGTRAERGNQTQRSVWTGPLSPVGTVAKYLLIHLILIATLGGIS